MRYIKQILKRVLPERIKSALRQLVFPEYERYAPPTWRVQAGVPKAGSIKCAVICDEFTLVNLKNEFHVVCLTPRDWRTQLEQERPDVLFCEAAWEGVDGEWNAKIYRNHECDQDNRPALKAVLKYCQKAHIPTVFWNKEDTPEFAKVTYDFIDTALLFDHIFTTCAECIPKYQALGHKSVHLMMFGYSPELFSVRVPRPQKGIAVFLGSWYEANKQRCEDMCRMFDMVLEQGLELRIYDRVSGRNWPDRQYPERYRPYVLPAVPYERTGEIMNEADYVININSVKDSQTMFARRVFEAMACGRIVISNESVGLQALFPGRIWFLDRPFDRTQEACIIAENLETVRANYTFCAQLSAALNAAGIK